MKRIVFILVMMCSTVAYSQLHFVSPKWGEQPTNNQRQTTEINLYTVSAVYYNESNKEYDKTKVRVSYDEQGDLRAYQIYYPFDNKWSIPAGINDVTHSYSIKARMVDKNDGELYDYFDWKFRDDHLGYVYFNFSK